MDVHECSFCKTKIELGTGTMYVKKDGAVFYFCGSKCEKNMLKLERLPRKLKWTRAAVIKPVKKEEPEKIKKKTPKKEKKSVKSAEKK